MTNEAIEAFISHASEDKDRFVRQFATRLRARGVNVWLDEWEINPGDNPVRKIFEEGLSTCKIIILVMSAKSVTKPWVREELDAAFVKKVEGKARLIPIRLDGCQMPECLKTTYWQAIDNLDDYDNAFERILNGIFSRHPKPPLGQPPRYTQAPVLQIGELTQIDALLFEKACRITIQQGDSLVDDGPWLTEIEGLDLTKEQIADSQEILEEYGYITIHRTIGPHRIHAFSVTFLGFQQFAEIGVPRFNEVVCEVAAHLLRNEFSTGDSLAQALNQPLRVSEHILELLENKNLIKISRQYGGSYMTVWQVSAKLRRMVENGG
jgi:hypothetical protein